MSDTENNSRSKVSPAVEGGHTPVSPPPPTFTL